MRYEILRMLKEGAPGYVSGEALSRRLEVTRTAVWKHIRELKSEGYVVEASSRKGYKLVSPPEGLSGFEAGYNLGTAIVGRKVLFFDSLDSTNDYAKKAASEGSEEGTVVIAGTQTAGRGRYGRVWESRGDTGIYMSVILRPVIAPEDIQLITIAASTAVVAAVESVTGIRAGIKWPNDIILESKKVCGILTEMNSEMDRVNFIVLGIGINFSQKPEDFPPELRDKAISLLSYAGNNGFSPDGCKRLDLIRAVLRQMDRVYALVLNGNRSEIIEFWKRSSVTLDKRVRIVLRDREFTGTAADIKEDGRLVVRCDDGTEREVFSGEVSVRGLLGYE